VIHRSLVDANGARSGSLESVGPQQLLLVESPPKIIERAGGETESASRRALESDLCDAISRNEFELRYQTIVEFGTQQVRFPCN
jgi:hypothetical protein